MCHRARSFVLLTSLALTACGGNSVRHFADGPPASDAPGGDAALQPVTLTITNGTTPVPSIHVYFQNADSSLVVDATTDASGTASAVMAAGGYVTAIDPFTAVITNPAHTLETFSAVKPGDHLVLNQPAVTPITVNISPPFDSNASAVRYRAYTSCSATPDGDLLTPPSAVSPAITAVSLTNCGGMADVLIVVDNGTANPFDFTYAPNTPVSDQATIDLTAATYSATTNRDYTYNNVSNPSQNIDIADILVTSRGAVFESIANTSGNPATQTRPIPVFTGASDVMWTMFFPATFGIQNFIDWGPYTSSYTTDFASKIVADYTTYPVYTAATHTLSWTETAAGTTADTTVADLRVNRPGDTTWAWRLAAPHATSLVFPQLPTTIHDFNVGTNDIVTFTDLISAKLPGGYDGVRAQVLALQPDQFTTGTTGTLSFQRLAPLSRKAPR
jgi:hypothetical protein